MKAIDKYPMLPTSVLHLERKIVRQDLRSSNKKTADSSTGDEYAFNSSRSKFGNFDREIARFAISYFNREKRRIVDPFSGWGERGFTAIEMGIEYVGLDISPKAIKYAGSGILANSLFMPLPDDSCGFSITCPPYWNLERYEKVPNQLSEEANYEEFLRRLSVVIGETRRVLIDGGRCAWIVADFRKSGILYDFSTDVINSFKGEGFSLFDKIILDKSKRYRIPLFIPQADRMGYTVKVHEYILVFI